MDRSRAAVAEVMAVVLALVGGLTKVQNHLPKVNEPRNGLISWRGI